MNNLLTRIKSLIGISPKPLNDGFDEVAAPVVTMIREAIETRDADELRDIFKLLTHDAAMTCFDRLDSAERLAVIYALDE